MLDVISKKEHKKMDLQPIDEDYELLFGTHQSNTVMYLDLSQSISSWSTISDNLWHTSRSKANE
jgi:hypothetical protein